MKNKFSDYIGITSIFVFILTAIIALTILATPIYEFALNQLEIPQRVGMTHDQIMENYYTVLRYLHFPWIDTLVFPDFPVSASGAFHFWEVKILFYINYALLFTSGILSFLYVRKINRTGGWWRLVAPFKIAIFVPFLLLLILAIDFDWMFVMFHNILFNNDAWIFNAATDPIITVLPQEFFMYTFIFAFVLIEASFIGGYFFTKRRAFK